MGAMAKPEQTVSDVVVNVTRGMGFTVMLTVVSLKQPLALALTVNTVVCGVLVLFTREPEMMFPVPVAGIPVTLVVLFLVQLKVVPLTVFGLETMIWEMIAPEQMLCSDELTDTAGEGLTVMVKF
jgi:hypothetical protein